MMSDRLFSVIMNYATVALITWVIVGILNLFSIGVEFYDIFPHVLLAAFIVLVINYEKLREKNNEIKRRKNHTNTLQ